MIAAPLVSVTVRSVILALNVVTVIGVSGPMSVAPNLGSAMIRTLLVAEL